ncbi:alpha/beta hydrolase [Xanthomonas euroxanthea]|nr:alpha/beta hydrolase [Xanthomonas euroxanthea]CAE1136299.1 alpha/beta hydrolase [Xanthomonas euroxanthea]
MSVAAAPPTEVSSPASATLRVTFKNNNGTSLVGNLHLPVGFDKAKRYPAIVTVGPASGVKEQTAGLYAAKMAQAGYVAIAFDPSFNGESGGLPRFKEDPYARVEDIRGAVDYLVSLPYIEENRIGVLGICAGGSYAASAAMTERRIKAVALAVPVDGGTENRAGGQAATIEMLDAIARQRTVEARGGEPMIVPWMPEDYKDAEDIDLREGYRYYMSGGGVTPNWPNKMRFTSMDAALSLDAYNLAETLLTQPLEVIVGSKPGGFGSNKSGHLIYERAASRDKELTVLEGASHFDLYDNPKYVDVAVQKFDAFFDRFLK